MKITRNNYEQFFLDYFEGNLPDNRVGELMRFLDENPDLRDEFDAFELIRLDGDDGVDFPGKDSLKKSVSAGISPDNYEEYFAAYVEGDLDKSEIAEVEAFAVSDPHYGRELELMQQTRLVPDPAIRFPRKGSLKQHHIGFTTRRVLHYASAAAAALLLGVVAFTLFPLQETLQVSYDQRVGEYEQAVEEEVAQPEAVAEAPAPQREEGVASLREEAGVSVSEGEGTAPARATALPAELFRSDTAPVPAYADERLLDDTRETLASRPMMASRMESRQVESYAGDTRVADDSDGAPVAGGSAPERLMTRAELTPREEYIWLAYRDPGHLAMDDPDDWQELEGGLSRLAANRLQETAGVDFRRMEETLTESRSGLAEFADRSVSEVSRFLSGLVTVNEQRADGRRVQLAIGNVIEVSRTAPGE